MPTISVRLDEETKQWLDEVVAEKGLNASALIRDALVSRLKEMDEKSNLKRPIELELKDRLLLSNQFRILAMLEPENDSDHLQNAKIVERGYERNYSSITEWFYDGFPRKDCNEVIEILELYRALNFSYKQIEDRENITENDIAFFGFDGNSEGLYMDYAEFWIEDKKRFQELREPEEFSFNSHSYDSLGTHRKRLRIWKELGRSKKMTISDIRQVIGKLT